jgi:hypothetical protein
MLEREIGLTGKEPEQTAPVATGVETRVAAQAMVDQPDRDIDVLAELSEDEGSEGEDVRVVRAGPKCLSGKIDTRVPGRLQIIGPASRLEPLVTMGRQGKSRAILRIAFYRLLEQARRSDEISAACKVGSMTLATLEATLSCRSNTSWSEPSKRSAHRCAPVAASTSWPDPVAGFAHRAFEHLAHTQFVRHLLQSTAWPLYVKLELRGDDEEPADAAAR